MISYNELKEKCTCWTGYKRKPGTKPCADGSCIKEGTDDTTKENHHVMAFGRMNPITSGHEAVVNKVHSVAKEHGASHNVVVSHSQDAKKNPLSGDQKVAHAKNAFPGTTVSSASKESPTILHHAAAAHKAGATHLHVVAGSDRHEEMHNLLHKYNGKDSAHGHYNFKKITVHSSGERDPDSEGTTGISASKMREHAASGNKAEFHKGAPSKMKPEHKDAMYHDVRKGMNIKEETTPYWKKPSFNKRMSQMAKQERLERERKEAEKKPVKEETLDQQDDHAKQLKRFKDQMTKLNGPNKETETELDKVEKEIMTGHVDANHGLAHNPDPAVDAHVRVGKIKHMTETLRPEMGAASYINDFIKSTNPRFNNKSKEERRKMAIGAFMAAKAKGVKEEVQIDELSTELLGKYKTAAGASAKASDEAGNYKKGDKRFAGINKATRKQFDNDLKKHDQVKESNSHYDKAEENRRSADSAKEKGDMFAHHLHMSDYHDNMADWHDSKGRHGSVDGHLNKAHAHRNAAMALKEGTIQQNGTDQIETSTSAPSASTTKDTTMGKKIKGFKFFNGENDKQMNMNQPVKEEVDEGYQSHSGRSHGNPYGGGGFGKREREDDEGYDNEPHYKPVAPTLHRKYIKGTPENKAAKAASKPINGHPTNEEVETIDEKSVQARRNKTWKNLMATAKGARINQNTLGMKPSDTGHKNARDMNKAIGRAAIRGELDEMKTGNPGFGYHGQHQTTHDADEAYKNIHAHVKGLTDSDDKTVKHYLDSAHGRHLVGHESDHEHIKKDFKKFQKHYRPEMHEAVASKAVNVDKVNHAGDKPHEEKWEPAKNVSKLKKEETMKSYKEFLQSLDEVKMADLPSRKIQGRSYGADYSDPEGADETAADMKKPAKAAGRKAGQSTGSYKPRKTMSKLKAAGATYK